MVRPPKETKEKRRPGRPKKSSPAASATSSRSGSPLSLVDLVKSLHGYRPIEWVRLGIPAIDLIIGAGIPRGRMIEVVGDYATAKSALCYSAIGAFQRAGGQCILIDSEAKTDRAFAEKVGGFDLDKIGYMQPKSIKESIQIVGKVANMADPKMPTLVCWDSLAATPGSEELDFVVSDQEFKSEKAARARELSMSFRAVCGALASKDVTFMVVNQLRTNFNFMGRSFMESPGGKSTKYHSGVRIMMRNRGKIRHKVQDVITGIAVEVEAIKNAMAPPFRKAQLKFKFDTGFDAYSGLDELLLKHGRITQRAGWLCYGEKTFRGADMERIAAEIPDLIAPLTGVIDNGVSEDAAAGSEPAPEDATEATASVEDNG